MPLPFFYAESLPQTGTLTLDEENSKHIVQVLRMQATEELRLTDGKGRSAIAAIAEAHKKHCTVHIISSESAERVQPHVTIAVSLVKNQSRFEWFLEKATELGTSAIIPLIAERTEKQHARHDRFINICKSAMLQSGQSWMPELHQPRSFKEIIAESAHHQKFIAYCNEEDRKALIKVFDPTLPSHIILIGPEGDFTQKEVELALSNGFSGVTLGPTRLRTETAGMYAAAVCRRA